jgi:hypothetical protein
MALSLGRRPKPKQPLSDMELKALCSMADGKVLSQPTYERLKKLGFIEQGSGGWKLTHQGQIEVIFCGAR